MDRASFEEDESIRLPTHATSRTKLLRAYAFLFGGPVILVGALASLSDRGQLTSESVLLALAYSVIAPAIVLIGVEEVIWVREVDLTRQGVVFRFRFHQRVVEWSRLGPTVVPAYKGGWRVVATSPAGSRLPFPVTMEQARAIIESPWHKPWNLLPNVSDSLNLVGAPAE